MLTFTCDYCGASYDALLEGIQISYMDGNKRAKIDDASKPCGKCNEEAEAAKQLALENRKKLRQNL